MTIYFRTPGLIELPLITIMGASVKVNDNSIGMFGTGLKYAIATLLRTGHKVVLRRGSEVLNFRTKAVDLRGEPFELIYMNEQQLGFTTSLGKNWKPWQAFRELHSNTLDEHGETTPTRPTEVAPNETIFEISGEGIEEAYEKRDSIFLATVPTFATPELEFHPVQSDAPNNVYYRGVRVYTSKRKMFHCYNILKQTELTEDRTLASTWDFEIALLNAIVQSTDKELIRKVILANTNEYYEAVLSFSYINKYSKEYLEVVESNIHRADLNPNVKTWYRKIEHGKTPMYVNVKLTEKQLAQLTHAAEDLTKLNCTITIDEIIVVETLGPNILGLYDSVKDVVVLSLRVFDMGDRYVTSTLYEEYLHKVHGFEDCTRELQNYLFDKLITLIESE